MTAFDFTNILNDERKDNLGPAVISYIMHRTMDVSVNQGYPALYFVDETAPLLRHDFFAAKFAAGLQEGRKLDRKRVVQGKSVSVRVDLGGRRIMKKKKKQN